MSPSPVTGVWSLRSFDLHLADAPNAPSIFQPLGENPLGRILFTGTGYMFCTLTSRAAASPIQSPSWIQATDDEVLTAARTLTTYCGPYRLFTENGEKRLSTQVEIALDPTWIGKPQVRRWEIKQESGKELLVLMPVQEFPLPDGTRTVGVLVWERVSEEGLAANL